MEVIAHRGFAADGAENSLSRLVAAAERADAVEFDVRLAADGEPVVVHDRWVDRLTDREGPVDDYTAAELGNLSLDGTDETIPTLATVLAALSGPIVPEIKAGRVTERLRSLLADYDDPVLVSSFRPGALGDLPAVFDRAVLCGAPGMDDHLPDGAPIGLDGGRAVARDLGATAIHPHYSLCRPTVVDACQDEGLTVNAWTVRNGVVGTAMRAAGVDGAITDSPSYV